MAKTYRRAILRPLGISDEDWSRLGKLLAAAVEFQRRLAAKSPHVLELTSDLQQSEDGSTYFVDHEPANPLAVKPLFDPKAPKTSERQLLGMAVALFDALRAAHSAEGAGPKVHGGLCPGVILVDPDGVEKVTDFGFAPGLGEVIGAESFVELAVGPCQGESQNVQITGAWEVLPPEEFERHDRICAFIDPEKYGKRALSTFEAGSDVIAAGFILHLMAEHAHPYLAGDPNAHRLAGMSEYMAMTRYTGARRKDLRESQDPAIQAWCKLVGDTLARTPQERPSASEALESLAEHVRPIDPAEIVRRRLAACEQAAQRSEWDEVRRIARSVAGSEAASAEATDRAAELLRQAEAHVLLQQALDLLDGDEWPRARGLLDHVRAMPALPEQLAQKATEAAKTVQQNVAVRQKLDALRGRLEKDTGQNPSATLGMVKEVTGRLDDLPPADQMLPVLRTQVDRLRTELSQRARQAEGLAERLERERQQAMEADRITAAQWLAKLEPALEQQRWDELTRLFAGQPALRHWPEDVKQRAADIRAQLDEYLAERERMAAIKADVEAAQGWLAQLGQAVESEKWDQAERILLEKPDLAHVPEGLIQEIDVLGHRVQALVTHFVEDILSERVEAFLPARRFDISVQVGEWKTRDELPTCQAALRVVCPTVSQTPVTAEVEVNRRDDDVVIADADRLERSIGDRLARLVSDAQKSALERVCEPLRSGLFPAAAPETHLTEPVASVAVTVRCLDREGGQGRIEVPLLWNTDKLTWEEQEPPRLRNACLDLALAEIDAALQREVIEASTVLTAQANQLHFELDPPTVEGDFPTVVRRGGALEFTRAIDGRAFTLERFEAAYPHERITGLYEKLKQAEQTLQQILAEGVTAAAPPGEAPADLKPPAERGRGLRGQALPVAAVVLIVAMIIAWALRPESEPAASPAQPAATPTEPGPTPAEPTVPSESTVQQTPVANADTQATPVQRPDQPVQSLNANQDEQADAALTKAVTDLQHQFTGFGELLAEPTHAQLLTLIEKERLDEFADDLLAIQDELPPEQTNQSSLIDEWLEQTLEWKTNLGHYSRVLHVGGQGVAEAIETAQAAQAIWPTAHVVGLLDKLNRISEPCQLYDRKMEERNWRAADRFLRLAASQADEAGLARELRRTIDDNARRLADARTEALEPAMQAAQAWLQQQGDPSALPNGLGPARDQGAARARAMLDSLDFPPSIQRVHAAEQEIIDRLLTWSTYTITLPPASEGGGAGAELVLTYIPADRVNAIDAVWMSQYEITVGQYRAVTGKLPLPDGTDRADEEMAGDDRHPVGYVTPDQARKFCSLLSERFEGELIFRLPFDVEWRHALLTGRGRVPSANPAVCTYDPTTGEPELDPTTANFESDEGAFFPPGHKDGFGRFAPVGSYAPNRWGLYDMLGNVREWTIGRADYKPITKGGSFRESVVGISLQRDPRLDFEVTLDTRTPYEDNGFRIVVLPP